MTDLEVRREPYDSPVAAGLLDATLAELRRRYGGEGDSSPLTPGEFDPPVGGFYVAYVGGVPAGCCAWRTYPAEPTTAELKRLFVQPGFRGLGVAKALLTAVEDGARAAGRARIWLETGTAQPEAIALYGSNGYDLIPDYGYYKGYPDVRSFGRDL